MAFGVRLGPHICDWPGLPHQSPFRLCIQLYILSLYSAVRIVDLGGCDRLDLCV
jgi:hypothetical protein